MSHVRVLDKLPSHGMPLAYHDRELEFFLLCAPENWRDVQHAIRRSNARVRARLRAANLTTERITR